MSRPVTVVAAGCDFSVDSGDAVRSAPTTRNNTRGFVSFSGGNCPEPGWLGKLRYFDGGDRTWRRATTPYTGRVLASRTT